MLTRQAILKKQNDSLCVFKSTASAVAQLYMALPHSPSSWSLQHTGVVCFVKDNPQRSYFFRMFDLKVNSQTEQHGRPDTLQVLTRVPPPHRPGG